MAATLGSEGDLRIEGVAIVGCQGLKKGVVADVDHVASAIDEAVSRVEREAGRSGEDVVVTVGGPHLQSSTAQGFIPIVPATRQIRQDDVLAVIGHSRQVVSPPDREQIMAIPREFRVDGQRGVAKPIGMSGGRLEVMTHIVTGLSSSLDLTDRAVTRAGRKVAEMVVKPLASGLGVARPEDLEKGCVVVDIGGGTTDVAVFANGAIVHAASLPVGGQHVTTDLATLLKTSPDEAERLKTQFGSAISSMVPEADRVEVQQVGQPEPRPMQRRVLCEIVESRMREIASLAKKVVDQSGIDPRDAVGYVTGGGAMLENTDALFSEVFGPVRFKLGSPKVAGHLGRSLDVPTMSTVVGLARYCLEGDEQEFAPISGVSNWKEKIRTLKNTFVKKG